VEKEEDLEVDVMHTEEQQAPPSSSSSRPGAGLRGGRGAIKTEVHFLRGLCCY
jgi:hypothetical protein